MAEFVAALAAPGPLPHEVAGRLEHALHCHRLQVAARFDTPQALALRGAPASGTPVEAPRVSALLFGDAVPRVWEMAAVPGEGAARDAAFASLVEAYGDECVTRLGGPFASVYSGPDGSARLATDRFGMRAVFVHRSPGLFLAASSVRLLASALGGFPPPDPTTLCEVLLFNYPLGEGTFLSGVETLPPGTRLEVGRDGAREIRWWEAGALIRDVEGRGEASAEGCRASLAEALRRRISMGKAAALSLTGGFDGRTLLSLWPEGLPNKTFTFGAPWCSDVNLARDLSASVGVPHRAILLDGGYLSSHAVRCGKVAVTRTEGRSTFLRAHYVRTAEVLCGDSDALITGICGSELLRPIHAVGEMYHPRLRALALSPDPLRDLDREIRERGIPWVLPEASAAVRERVVEHFRARWGTACRGAALSERAFLFTLREVFRKYFGPELEMESPEIPNRFPFLDEDFVETLCRSTFAGFRKRAFSDSPFRNRKNQEFYALLLRAGDRRLFEAPTGKGYSPKRLLEPAGFLKLAPGYFVRKFRGGEGDVFAIAPLEERFYGSIGSGDGVGILDGKALVAGAKAGAWREGRLEFAHAFSLGLWLGEVERGRAPEGGDS